MSAPATPETPPPAIARFVASGYARPGEMWAWWRLPNGDFCLLVRHAQGTDTDFELSVFPEGSGSWANDANGFTLGTAELAAAALRGTALRNVAWPTQGDARARVAERLARMAARPGLARAGYVPNSRTALFRLAAAPFEETWLRLPARIHETEWVVVEAAIRAEPAAAELLEEAAGCLPRDGAWIVPAHRAAPVLWAACAAQCSRDAFVIEATDTYFGDLAVASANAPPLSGAAAVALHLFLNSVDLADDDGARRPAWMQALRGRCLSGLLSPADARRIAAERTALLSWLEARAHPGDTRALLELVAEAARQGDWVVGLEPT